MTHAVRRVVIADAGPLIGLARIGHLNLLPQLFGTVSVSASPLLLMDDYRGRQAAQHSKIATIGTAGVLVLAKQAHAVAAIKPMLLALRANGYFLSDQLIDAVLAQAGEL